MAWVLVGLGMAAAVADWRAVIRQDKRAEYVFKPLVVGLLLAAAVLLREGNDASRWAFTVAALFASLLGDVFLMLVRERFVAGLGSFLFAHLMYVLAFSSLASDVASAVAGGAVLAAGSVLYARIRRGMEASAQGEMALPVAVYFLAIAAMVASALVTPFRTGWDGPHASLAIIGAALFMASDSLIGWTRFVRSSAWGPLAIIVTYHLAQVALLLALLG